MMVRSLRSSQAKSKYNSRTRKWKAHPNNKTQLINPSRSSRTSQCSRDSRWAHGTANPPNWAPHLRANPRRTFQVYEQTSSFPWPTWVITSQQSQLKSSTFRHRDSTCFCSSWKCFVWRMCCVFTGWWRMPPGQRITEKRDLMDNDTTYHWKRFEWLF